MEDLRFNFKMIRDEAASQVQDDVAAESTIRGDGDIGKAAKPRLDAAAKDLLILGSIAAEDMFSRMIDETKAALTRAFKLSTEDSRQKNSKDIADELLKELQKILEGSLASAKRAIPNGIQKSTKDFKYFEFVTNVSKAERLLRTDFEPYIASHFRDWHSTREEVIKGIKGLLDMLEYELGEGLCAALDGMTSRISRKLGKDKTKWENSLKSQSNSTRLGLTSEMCEDVVSIINEQKKFIMAKMSGKSQREYLHAYGSKLYKVLLEHFQNFKINPDCVTQLISDLGRFAECVAEFNVPAIDKKFEVLKAITTIFMVPPNKLPNILNEDPLAKVDPEIKRAFIKKRSDYETAKNEIPGLF